MPWMHKSWAGAWALHKPGTWACNPSTRGQEESLVLHEILGMGKEGTQFLIKLGLQWVKETSLFAEGWFGDCG